MTGLFEPVGDMVLGVEVVHEQADPARRQDYDGADDLSDQRDGFLENVDDGEDRKDQTDEIDDGSHCNNSY